MIIRYYRLYIDGETDFHPEQAANPEAALLKYSAKLERIFCLSENETHTPGPHFLEEREKEFGDNRPLGDAVRTFAVEERDDGAL